MLLGSNEELPSDEAAITVFHSLPPFLGIDNAINLDMAYAFREFPRRDGDLCDGGRERGVKTVVARLHDVVRHDIGVAGGDLLVTVFLGHTAHDSDSADTRRRLAAVGHLRGAGRRPLPRRRFGSNSFTVLSQSQISSSNQNFRFVVGRVGSGNFPAFPIL